MKWSDIPQFTQVGSYQVNVPLRFLKNHIDDLLAMGLQMNPDFQRGHVWTENQQRKYIEYFLRKGQSGRIIYLNQPSWGKVSKSSDIEYDDFVVVDGLQRLTALLKFVNNEIDVFDGHYYQDFEGKLGIGVDVLINVNNLKTRKEVLQWYLEMNEGGTPHTEEELDKVRDMLKEEE